MADINDLLGAVINKSPVDFASHLADIMNDRAEEAISARKIEIANSIYGNPEEDLPAADEIDDSGLDVDLDLDDIDADADVEGAEEVADTPEDNTEDEND